jgi:ankyrin repeat protein
MKSYLLILNLFLFLICGCYNKKDSLFRAINRHDKTQVETLLEKGVKVNIKDSKGSTPLMKAVINKDIKITSLLLNNGANPNIGDSKRTPIEYASLVGPAEIVELLIKFGADVNTINPESGKTPIFQTAVFNRYKTAEVLLKNGADLSISSRYFSISIIRWALYLKAFDVAKKVLDYGFDWNKTPGEFENLIQYTISANRPKYLELLLKEKKRLKNESLLILATQVNSIDIVNHLLKNGFDVNKLYKFSNSSFDEEGYITALDVAQLKEFSEIEKILLENGGKTALQLGFQYPSGGPREIDIFDRYGRKITILPENP